MVAELIENVDYTTVPVEEGDIHVWTLGQGEPLLLLHGHPQTHLIWHRLAPYIRERFQLVLTDLRGYGASLKPKGALDHSNYSKRTMAADQVAVMQALGHKRFSVCAHDRGARVAHRLCADHPDIVKRAMFLDIAPTLDMYNSVSREFATAYFHWFFLIQSAPFPEEIIGANPAAYVKRVMGNRHAGIEIFDPRALQAYVEALSSPGAVHGMCEDYRAAASIDLEMDQLDRTNGFKLPMPLRVLWGKYGVIEKCFDPIALWQKVATEVSGKSLPCGHYIPEEVPEMLAEEVIQFFLDE